MEWAGLEGRHDPGHAADSRGQQQASFFKWHARGTLMSPTLSSLLPMGMSRLSILCVVCKDAREIDSFRVLLSDPTSEGGTSSLGVHACAA